MTLPLSLFSFSISHSLSPLLSPSDLIKDFFLSEHYLAPVDREREERWRESVSERVIQRERERTHMGPSTNGNAENENGGERGRVIEGDPQGNRQRK